MSTEKALGIALIGAGNVGNIHAQAIASLPEAALVVVCDSSPGRAQGLAEKHGVPWCTEQHQAIASPGVEIVDVCTPSGMHMEAALAAAAAGRNVIVEKPLDVTTERVDGIIAACREAGVKLAGIFPSRFTKGAQTAYRAVKNGRLGRLTLLDAYVKWHRTQEYYDTGGWRGTWELDGGGALMNQSIHTIDLLQWFGGEVSSVYGRVATLAHRMETEDTAVALLTFAHGAFGVIEGATSTHPGEPARLELRGDQGTIVLEDGRIVRWDLSDASEAERNAMLDLEQSGGTGAADPTAIGFQKHAMQIRDMVSAIVDDRAPVVDGLEARKAVALVTAVYESARTGKTVTF